MKILLCGSQHSKDAYSTILLTLGVECKDFEKIKLLYGKYIDGESKSNYKIIVTSAIPFSVFSNIVKSGITCLQPVKVMLGIHMSRYYNQILSSDPIESSGLPCSIPTDVMDKLKDVLVFTQSNTSSAEKHLSKEDYSVFLKMIDYYKIKFGTLYLLSDSRKFYVNSVISPDFLSIKKMSEVLQQINGGELYVE